MDILGGSRGVCANTLIVNAQLSYLQKYAILTECGRFTEIFFILYGHERPNNFPQESAD